MRLIWTLIVILSCQPDPGMNLENVPVIKGTNDTIEISIQLDPGFSYYKKRSVESIAEEILLNGFSVVHYFVTNENDINGELIHAMQNIGIEVWLMTLGNGTYSTANYPEGWETWKMELNNTDNGSGGYTFLSPFNDEFVSWKKRSLVRLMTTYPFDGIELAEAYLPSWNGIARGRYGDVGPNAARVFFEKYGMEMPDFSDSDAPRYYKNTPEVYDKWITFRVNGVNHFLDEIFNGENGIREAHPEAKVATWSLGIDAGANSIEKLREEQGLDVPEMIELVKPDVHYIQTHWPDWIKSEEQLPADYTKHYAPFYREIKDEHPDLPVGIQADIGSNTTMIKSQEWFNEFIDHSEVEEYDVMTAYEYHLGGHIYYDPPLLKKTGRIGSDSIRLSFQKRIYIDTTMMSDNLLFLTQDQELFSPSIKKINIDGNRVELISTEFPESSFYLVIKEIRDTPEFWLYDLSSANRVENIKMLY